MPITKKDAPDVLPDGAKDIFVGAFNASYADTCQDRSDRDACASKIAWSAVKNKYKKSGDHWVPKSEALRPEDAEGMAEVTLTITKASLQKDGSMRWCATCSDTEPDGTGERTSLALFEDWIQRADNGQGMEFLPPPRTPFLGLSHYPAFEGAGEAGITQKMYIDGKQFKAAGVFQADNPLGQALFDAVRKELSLIKTGATVEQPIRISAAWWDLEHSHGKFIFSRRSLMDSCPMCAKSDDGTKQYLKGQLDHFAATRVPINPRTSLGLEEKSMAKVTRKDDAASIVGEELAKDLEEKAQEMIGKSETEEAPEALVVKAEDPEPASDVAEASEETEVAEVGADEQETPTAKAEVEEKAYNDEGDYLPYGGATTIAAIEAYMAEAETMDQLYNNWDMFTAAIGNILQSPMEDRIGAISALVGEFGDRVDTLKADVSDAFLVAQSMVSTIARPQPARAEVVDGGEIVMSEETTTTQTEEIQPEPAVNSDPSAVLGTAVKAALEDGALTREGKLAALQEALNTYAGAIKAELDAVAPPMPGEEMAQAIEKSMGALAEKLDLLIAKLDNRPAQPSQVPQQKSYAPTGPVAPQNAPQLPVSPQTGEPSALRAMIERSVGMHQ